MSEGEILSVLAWPVAASDRRACERMAGRKLPEAELRRLRSEEG